jgi:nascent polypeptide-associated complex subunit alpha
MAKLGMKPFTGINRVTIKKGKQLLLYIDAPEILKSSGADNSYIIFGEAKINDFA